MDNFANNLNWNLLHTFMIVAQEKSMTHASQVLHRTQPAISQAIKRLEEATEVKLLERNRSGLIPTQAGLDLLEQIKPIYATISRMPLLLDQAPEGLVGKIIIAKIDQISHPLLDKVIMDFFKEHPKVDLEIKIASTEQVLRSVSLGAVTIGISDGVIPSQLASYELLKEKHGLYCGSDHRFAGRAKISDAELRTEPFVNFTADILGGKHMGDITAYRAKASIGQHVRGHSSFVSEVRQMIEWGLGIGFLPIRSAEPYVKTGQLWRLPPFTNLPISPVYLIHNPDVYLTEVEQRFNKMISLNLNIISN
tara:strand:+ start:6665 stop:7588 length:924 start_codon:yes stop_codon:yes gene_type:complete